MTRPLVRIGTWLTASGLLAAILFSGYRYYRMKGSGVLVSAVLEIVAFAAFAGLLFLAGAVVRNWRKKGPDRPAPETEGSERLRS